MNKQTMTVNQQEQPFRCPECRFAAVCGECYWNEGGRCSKHGWAYVDFRKWACSSFDPA